MVAQQALKSGSSDSSSVTASRKWRCVIHSMWRITSAIPSGSCDRTFAAMPAAGRSLRTWPKLRSKAALYRLKSWMCLASSPANWSSARVRQSSESSEGRAWSSTNGRMNSSTRPKIRR
jgi:hypothetical protein